MKSSTTIKLPTYSCQIVFTVTDKLKTETSRVYKKFKLKEEDIISKKGVLKIEGEGRQDRAYEKTSDLDIPIKENDLPKSWADRNLKPLKDKLCHNPIIAFSAR